MTEKPAYLPNPFFASLTTVHEGYALVHGRARRFVPETIPFAAVEAMEAEALADLVPLLRPGEEVYLTLDAGETMATVTGLEMVATLPGWQMRLTDKVAEEEDPTVVRLTGDDVAEMLALKARAFPGFFGPRAAELGTFFGVRDARSGRLIAMGGERLATETDREVSAVCTDPEHLGQGHAARVVEAVMRHQARAGVRSMLHVTAVNDRAIALYERLGFEASGEIGFVKIRRG